MRKKYGEKGRGKQPHASKTREDKQSGGWGQGVGGVGISEGGEEGRVETRRKAVRGGKDNEIERGQVRIAKGGMDAKRGNCRREEKVWERERESRREGN